MNRKRGVPGEASGHISRPAQETPWRDYAELRCQMDELFSKALGYTPLARMFVGETELLDPDVDIYEIDDLIIVADIRSGRI